MWMKKVLGQEKESRVALGQTSACHCPPCTQHHPYPPPPLEAQCRALLQAACPQHRAAEDCSLGHTQA